MAVFLFVLAVLIHFILLSTDRFNWIEGPSASASVEQVNVKELGAQASANRTLIV